MNKKIAFFVLSILLISLLMSISSTKPVQATSHTTSKSIVVNGDFEAGNTGFKSDYQYQEYHEGQKNQLSEASYTVIDDPEKIHPAFKAIKGDHTTGSGKMMVVNGSRDTSKVVWQGTVNQDLVIGQSYDFSAWVANLGSPPAKLTFEAGGQVIDTLSPTEVGKWQRLAGKFTAQSTRPVLEMKNAQSAGSGNDFVVDDINIFIPETEEPPAPNNPGSNSPGSNSAGDVHIFSPDGLRYDFQEVGDFLAVQSTDGAVIVQARQAPWAGNNRASVNKAIAFWVDGDKVEIYLEPKRTLQINDQVTDFPTTKLSLPKGGVIDPTVAQNEIYIHWPDNSFAARVIMHSASMDYGVARYEQARTFEGFFSNMDGNPANDLQFRNSDEQLTAPPGVADLKRFGDSWRLSAEESLFDGTGPAGSPEPPMLLQEIDPEQRESARKTCREGEVTEETALRNCTYDVGITGDEEFVKSAKIFQEALKESPPPAELSAQPGETLGGPIFDAAQANPEGITIMDGDDLIVTTGESADGKSYLRFHIYHNGEYVTSFSIGIDATIADAVAQGLLANIKKGEQLLLQEDSIHDISGSSEKENYVDLGLLNWDFPNYTIEVWFKTTSEGKNQDILVAPDEKDARAHGILLETTKEGTVRYLHRSPVGTSGGDDLYSKQIVTDGKMHYLVAVMSNDEMAIYLDGKKDASKPVSAKTIDKTLNVGLGRLLPDAGQRQFEGQIGKVRIWSRVLTEDEISHEWSKR